ncbi:MAG: peptidylprolyl isomerase [Hyphomicrobiaceae bacterium]
MKSVCLALSALLCVGVPLAAGQERIIAKVNDRPITEADVRLAETEIGADLEQFPADVRRRVVVEFLIQNELFAAAAIAGGSPAISMFKEHNHYWDRRSMRDTYFATHISGQISEAAVRAFYNRNVRDQARGEEIRASHILLSSEEKANEIFELIAHDGDFAELARGHSLDVATQGTGGDLGYFSRGKMTPELEKAAFALPVGDVSFPVRSQFGWHVIKVVDKRKRPPPPYDAAKNRILDRLQRDRAKALSEDLRAKAKVEIFGPTAAQ